LRKASKSVGPVCGLWPMAVSRSAISGSVVEPSRRHLAAACSSALEGTRGYLRAYRGYSKVLASTADRVPMGGAMPNCRPGPTGAHCSVEPTGARRCACGGRAARCAAGTSRSRAEAAHVVCCMLHAALRHEGTRAPGVTAKDLA
jgi:hypothetical protein